MPEYDDLMKFEDIEYEKTAKASDSSSTDESGISISDSASDERPSDDIEVSLPNQIFVIQNAKLAIIMCHRFYARV